MSDLLIDTQAVPSTPPSGKVNLFLHNTLKQLVSKDDAGRSNVLTGHLRSYNVADVVATAADTYLTGSGIAIPTGLALQVGTTFKWRIGMTKTAAGVATPTWRVRIGTAGSVADTARLTFTGPAQTAVVDTGFVELVAILRNIGAAGILAGILFLTHNLDATGFAVIGTPTLQNTSAGFDTTPAGLVIGVSIDPGAAGVWTHQVIEAEAYNL